MPSPFIRRVGGNERGFTLLELLIAATMLAIVAMVVVSSFTNTLASIERARERSDVSQTARLVLERMFWDLSSTFFYSEEEAYRFVDRENEQDEPRGLVLSFVTVVRHGLREGTTPGGLARVEYLLGPHPENEDETALYRRETGILGGEGETPRSVALMGEYIRKFYLEYFDETGTVHTAWDSDEAEGERSLPVGVRITLVLGRAGPGQTFKTVVPIP